MLNFSLSWRENIRRYMVMYVEVQEVKIRRWKYNYIHGELKKGIGQLLYCHSSRGTKHSSGAYEHA